MNYDAKSNQYLQGKQDCAIVSIANLLKIDYARVVNALYSVGGVTAIDRLNTNGVSGDNLKLTLEYLTRRNWVVKTPRRGQEKFIGIASWHHGVKAMGHANIIKYGNVYETTGYVYTLEQYRRMTKMTLRAIYAPVA